MLHAELSHSQDIRDRFLREGHAANAVKHPGAVVVLDDDVAEDGSAFLVMELLHGESVEDLWERRGQRLPLELVADIGIQLLDVLSAAHAHGVIHRDIKPANVFLTDQGQLKVLDFGIARLRDLAAGKATQTGFMLGTPAFMAPEQAMAKSSEIDARTDIWAVAATMFALASGRLVHEAENAQQIMIRAAMNPAPLLSSVLPDAPASLCAVVDRALSYDRAQRWETAAAMRDALQSASRSLPLSGNDDQPVAEAAATMLPFATPFVQTPGPSPRSEVPVSALPSLRAAPNEVPVRSSQINAATVESHGIRAFRSPALATPAAPAQPQLASRVGQTTAQPVSRQWTTTPPQTDTPKPYSALIIGGRPVGPRLIAIAGLVAATLAVSAGALVTISLGKSSTPTADPSAAGAPASAPAESPVPLAVATFASPSSSAAKPPVLQLGPPVPPSGPAAIPAVAPAMPAIASAVPAAPPGTSAVGTTVAPANATTEPPWVAPVSRFLGKAPANPKSNCTPPFEYDAQGTKRWKRECLQR
jgi:serine/threonine-protein kinase